MSTTPVVPATPAPSPGGRPARLAHWCLQAVRLRFAGGRRGSVLILVVALLVLLALIGTAFITSAGADRDATVQHGYNTQVLLLVDGVVQTLESAILNDVAPSDPPPTNPPASPPPALPAKGSFRPATPTVAIPGAPPVPAVTTLVDIPKYYSNVDFVPWDAFLAERYPTRPGGGQPEWRYVTASPLAGARGDPSSSDPSNSKNPNLFATQFKSPLLDGTHPNEIRTRFRLAPTFVDIATPTGIKRRHPAFLVNDAADPVAAGKVVLAADADGDGIADSGLFELPVGQINGVRYYAAVRVVDNSAAFNASVAWEQAEAGSSPSVSLTPANVGLRELLDQSDPTRFDAFNTYRFGDLTGAPLVPVRDGTTPTPDNSFGFWTPYDAYWTMLGSRLDNPGYADATHRYRALGLSESAALAYRFCLANPNGSQSVMERYFPSSTRSTSVSRLPFTADQAALWYQTIFDYEGLSAAATPIRPLVVAHNAVSNFVPAFVGRTYELGTEPPLGDPNAVANYNYRRNGQYRFRGTWDNLTTYYIGEWVTYNGRAYVACANGAGAVPNAAGATSSLAKWALAPWYNHPVKLNLNTANYGLLMAAYHGIMADGPVVKPAGTPDPAYGISTPVWTFGPVGRNLGASQVSVPVTPAHVKQLRAALAAVNTIDLRDEDDNVTSRSITLTDDAGGTPVQARVYGTERQPYITEVVTNLSDLNRGYVCVELFNPYPVPLELDAFQLAYRNRVTGAGLRPVGTDALLNGLKIQPYGYCYLESSNTTPTRPNDCVPPATVNGKATVVVEVPELAYLVDPTGAPDSADAGLCELLLLRTRQWNGVPKTGSDGANTFNEANLGDLIPVDQIDFFGILAGRSNIISPQNDLLNKIPVVDRYHYRRSTWDPDPAVIDPNTHKAAADPLLYPAWHCVYAGPYDRAQVDPNRRQYGWVRDQLPDPATPTLLSVTVPGYGLKQRLTTAEPLRDKFVAGDATIIHTATYRTRPLQMNSQGMPGPWKFGSAGAGPAKYPWGGFARVGDVMAVPFVGGYLLTTSTATPPVPSPPATPTGPYEMNSVTADAALAEDGDLSDDIDPDPLSSNRTPLEQLGRFCPIYYAPPGGPPAPPPTFDDYAGVPSPTNPAANTKHRYAWARDLFEYFTVISPQDDYMPNVDPGVFGINAADPTLPPSADLNPNKWRGGTPQAVPNGLTVTTVADANGPNEESAATHGLINLNTANSKVIAQIPFSVTGNPANDQKINRDIATSIVVYREANGPFRSLFDLQNLPVTGPTVGPTPKLFHDVGVLGGSVGTLDPGYLAGDLTPAPGNVNTGSPNSPGGAADSVQGDFEARYLMINRISNMVSFRSDSFTAYVLVQGWRNAGTSAPELVVQRRVALVVDRSTARPKLNGAVPNNADVKVDPTFSTTNIPNN